jgi:hypothetical protein
MMVEFLALLFIKHYIVDFVLQTPEMIASKGTYGDRAGIWHSTQQGIGTFIAGCICLSSPIAALWWALVDGFIHYHIDWAKMKYGCGDITNPRFWNHLGLDQLAHYLTYLMIAVI